MDIMLIKLKIFLGKYLHNCSSLPENIIINIKNLSLQIENTLLDSVIGLRKEFDDMNKVFNYVNNYRFADVRITEDVEYYYIIKNNGCCGFYDDQITIDGNTYLIGCNYGH